MGGLRHTHRGETRRMYCYDKRLTCTSYGQRLLKGCRCSRWSGAAPLDNGVLLRNKYAAQPTIAMFAAFKKP